MLKKIENERKIIDMNKNELVKAVVSEKSHFTQAEVAEIVDTVMDVIKATVASGERVNLVGFGAFECVERAERSGRNPQTGEEIVIAAFKSPKFKPSKGFKDAVNA